MAGWQNEPFKVEMKAGEMKAFCRCGKSQNAPFCDGSHKGTEVEPERIKAEEDKTLFICGCQQSGKLPFCDGTHKSL